MNFVDLSIQFQVEASDQNPCASSNIASEEHPNHPHPKQMQVILYSRPSDVVTGKQAGTVQGALRKDLGIIERHLHPEWKKAKTYFRPLCLPEMQADDLEDIGILVGEVYDEKIIEESYSR